MAYLMYDITSVLFSFLSIQPRLSAVAFHLEIAMTKTDRPNRDALSDALDIYRDAMRPFIVRHLKRVRGKGVEDAIGESLHDRQAEQFRQNLAQGRSVEDAIDINDFPNLVSRQWHAVFKQAFGDDRTVQSLSWMIVTVRNEVAHPNTQDMDAEYARSRLYDIADVLGRINASDAKRDVEGIRDRLVSESVPRDAPCDAPSDREQQTQVEPTISLSGPTIWQLHLRPMGGLWGADNRERQAKLAVDLCRNLSVLGMGWPVKADPDENISWSDYVDRSKDTEWKKVNDNVRRWKEDVKIGDLVWTRTTNGEYLLARVTGEWRYEPDTEFTDADMVNIREVEIVSVGNESQVGKVAFGRLTLSRINGVDDFSRDLWNKCSPPTSPKYLER